ncbi:MAG: hypothetical protein IT204_11585 [Fimbriimonadaceae bacterium]|nr:hypothetical protein [Fimbriimonadaceae bacterium]
MLARWTRRRRRGQGLAEVAVVCSIMSSLAGAGGGAAWQVLGAAHRVVATNELKQIYTALTMYDDEGRLPSAVMYPDIRRDPNAVRNDPRSIVRQLGNLVPPQTWVASRAPQVFQQAGLTFIWNSALNGQLMDNLGDPARTWLLMDMNAAGAAFPDLFPQPGGIGYLVLYADGHVKYEMQPPPVVRGQDNAALRGMINAGGGAGAPAAGGPAAGGGATPAPKPEAVAPKDPDAAERQKEAEARKANPDEDDALDE